LAVAVGNWQKKKKRGNEETEKRKNMGSGNLFASEGIEMRLSETMKILALVHCRGLIYQALSQTIHPLGLMNQTPTSESIYFLLSILIADSGIFIDRIRKQNYNRIVCGF
jgi:hypothetical protein